MLAPGRLLRTLFSFELLFVLSLASSAYVGHPMLARAPVPPGILALAASLALGLVLIARGKLYVNSFNLPLAALPLTTWLLLSKMWSPSEVYGMEKLTQFIGFVAWPMAATAILIAPDPERVRRLLVAWIMVGVVIGAEALRVWLTEDVMSIHIGNVNYLAIGRVVGAAAIISLVIWLFDRGKWRWLALGLCGFFTFLLLISGGRGALLAFLLAMLCALLIGFRSSRTGFGYQSYQIYILGLFILLVTGVTVWLALAPETPRTLERMAYLFEREGGGASASGRMTYMSTALRLWTEAPLTGHGIGSFPVLSGAGDVRHYPHNMILELLVETGLIGLACFGWLVAVALRRLRLAVLRQDPLLLCSLMLLVQATVNAMLSLDLPGNRMFFYALALITLGEYRSLAAVRRDRPVAASLTSPVQR